MYNSLSLIQNIFNKYKDRSTLVDEQSQWPEERHLKHRSATIDKILANYATQQQERYNFKTKNKHFFVRFFVALLIGLISFSIFLFVFALKNFKNQQIEFLTCIITSVFTCFSSIISILLIIVNYLFPNDEEKYFNDLVAIIVQNDTKRLQDISKNDNKGSSNNTTNENQ